MSIYYSVFVIACDVCCMLLTRRGEVSGLELVRSSASTMRSVADDGETNTDLSVISSSTSEQHPLSASRTHRHRASLLVSMWYDAPHVTCDEKTDSSQLSLSHTAKQKTRSSALAERPRDASCPSVVSFSVRYLECRFLLLVLWLHIYYCICTIDFCSLLFCVFVHAAGCDKQRFTDASPSVQYTAWLSIAIVACTSSRHRLIAIYSCLIAICVYPTCIRCPR